MTTRVSNTQLPKGPAAGRPAWVGTVQVGHLSAEIGLFSAAMDPPRVHGAWVHLNCGEHVKCPRCCPVHGDLETSEIGTQFHVDGRNVVLTAEALSEIKLPRQDAFEFSNFCLATAVEPFRYSGLNYYPLARSPGDAEAWATVLSTLRKARVCAIGEIVIRGTRSLTSLQAIDDHGCFVGLRYPEHIRRVPQTDIQTSLPATENSVNRRLLRSATARARQVRWEQFADRSAERLLDVIRNRDRQRPKRERAASVSRVRSVGAASQV